MSLFPEQMIAPGDYYCLLQMGLKKQSEIPVNRICHLKVSANQF